MGQWFSRMAGMRKRVVAFFSSPLAVLEGEQSHETIVEVKGDFILKRARLVGRAGLYDVLVRDGTFASIQPTGGMSMANDVDVQGRWLAPGLIDWHVHSKLSAHHTHRLDLKAAKSARETLSLVKAALSNPLYDRPELVGINMRNGEWEDADIMSRSTLDEVSTARPIYLFYNGYHSMVVNSVGLERIGISPAHHSGVLVEQEAFNASAKISKVDEVTMDRWVQQEAYRAASLGITEIVDLEMDFGIRDWQRRCQDGFHTLRVHVGVYNEHFADALKQGYKSGDTVRGTNGLITVGPFKIVSDGSLGSQTAYCHESYPGTSDHGLFAYPPPSLRYLTRKATSAGFYLAIHAIGDRANQLVLQTLASNPHPPLPGSTIEHAQLLDFEDIDIFRKLGLVASVQPRHLVDDRETCLKYWPGREGRAWALKALRDSGVGLKFGSDSPVAEVGPFEAMAVAMSRGEEGGPTLSEDQAIDVVTAWISSTSNGKKSIQQGDRADLVVIDRDPLQCNPHALRRIQVFATMVNGIWTYGKI